MIAVGQAGRLVDDRSHWHVRRAGTYVEWPSIDEHIGVWTLLGVSEGTVLGTAGFTMGKASAR